MQVQSSSCYFLRAIRQAVWQGRLQAVNKPQMTATSHAPYCGRLLSQKNHQEKSASQPALLLYASNHGPGHRASSARGFGHSKACGSRARCRGLHSSGDNSGWRCNVTRSAASLAQRCSKPGTLHSVEDHGNNYSSSSASAATPDASDRRSVQWQLEAKAPCHCWPIYVIC